MATYLYNDECLAPFSRYGGKGATAKWYRSLLPPHRTYVEPYCGSAALLFSKERSKVEVINDRESDIVNFFTVLREQSTELERLINHTPISREEFERYEQLDRTSLPPMERARIFYVRIQQSFASLGDSWAYGRKSVKSFHSSLQRFGAITERLQQVQIEHLDGVAVIKKYDSPHTLFFVDPPYEHEGRVRRKGYHHEMDQKAHEELLETLLTVRGKVLLCGYPNGLYESRLNIEGWRRIERNDKCKTGGLTNGEANRPNKVEVVWMNYSDPMDFTLKSQVKQAR